MKVSEQEKVDEITSYERLSAFFDVFACLHGFAHMVIKTFFSSWRYCTCVWLRLVGIWVKVLRGGEECVVCFEESHVYFFGFLMV